MFPEPQTDLRDVLESISGATKRVSGAKGRTVGAKEHVSGLTLLTTVTATGLVLQLKHYQRVNPATTLLKTGQTITTSTSENTTFGVHFMLNSPTGNHYFLHIETS